LGRGLASAKLRAECGRFGKRGRNSGSAAKLPQQARGAELILDTKTGAGSGGRAGLASNFHFSDLPTVTAGFIAFSFDIRKYFK
jgi:hypothetical protein